VDPVDDWTAAASMPSQGLGIVPTAVAKGFRPLRWALEQNLSSMRSTSSYRTGRRCGRPGVPPSARRPATDHRLSLDLAKGHRLLVGQVTGVLESPHRAPLNRRAASWSGNFLRLLTSMTLRWVWAPRVISEPGGPRSTGIARVLPAIFCIGLTLLSDAHQRGFLADPGFSSALVSPTCRDDSRSEHWRVD